MTQCRRRRTWVGAGVALTLAVALSSQNARAQAQQSFYLDRLVIAGAPDDGIGVWRPQVGERARFYGQLGLGFALNAFRLENEIKDPSDRAKLAAKIGGPNTSQLTTYADVGVEFYERFGIQVEMPVILYQHTNPTNDTAIASARDDVAASAAAPEDLRLDFRAVYFRNDARTLKLGAQAAVWIPTGDEYSYGGDRASSAGIFASGEVDLKQVFFTLNTGFHFRPVGGVNDFKVSDEWTYAFGAFLPLRGDSLRLGAELFGSVGITKGATKANTPLEWMVEGRFYTDIKKKGWLALGGGTRLDAGYSPDFRMVGFAGYSFSIFDTNPPSPGKRFRDKFADHGADTDHDGIPDDVDLCPLEPEDHKPPNTDDGCPALPDRDGDGIPDISDKCPDNPEDFDGIQDLDGCPEDDADKDGVPDAQDKCPLEPGEPNTKEPEKNGCPTFIRRIKGSSDVELLKPIEFETGKATILKKSYPIVDEVVRLMKVNVDIKKMDIEGHTDNKGSDELNEKLSNDRAHSVMKYLADHGIEADRLEAHGYGPKRPIADNNTVEGRQRNRRVEFHIRGQSQQPQGNAPTPQEKPNEAPKQP